MVNSKRQKEVGIDLNTEIINQLRNSNRHFFVYGGKSSLDFDLHVSYENTPSSPEYDLEFVEVYGRDGDLTLDNKRMKSFSKPIITTLQTQANVDEQAHKISQWLKTDIRYKELNLSWDPYYTYRAIFFERYDIEDILPKFGRLRLPFRWHPVKYRNSGLSSKEITHGYNLYNPELRLSKPLIQIIGNGEITLYVNGKEWCLLKDVFEHITIDSDVEIAKKNKTMQNNKLIDSENIDLYPLLQPGDNIITWTGEVQSVHITPRWEAVAT